MTFHAFGLNYQTAPVSVREAFALSEGSVAETYRALACSPEAEVVILSTCNRTEVYLFGTAADASAVQRALGETVGTDWPAEQSFHLQDEAAVLHALRVTAGTASQVIGDAQILAQMKQAYRQAVEAERVGTVLHRLMHTAFRAAKRVRAETSLADGAASVSSVAVQAARDHFEHSGGASIAGRRVLLVGLGHMGVAALRALRCYGVREIALANRSRERAENLAAEFGAEVVAWEERHAAAARADLVIVASAAQEPVLLADQLPPRAGAPALLIDVAVPRNVEPTVSSLPGYQLVDIDALNRSLEATACQRAQAVPAAEVICEECLTEFVAWVMHHEALRPALHALKDTFEAIRRQAIEQYAHRFVGTDRDEIEVLTRSILQKLLAVPIVRLKANDPESLDFVRGVRFLGHVFSRPGCDDESARDITLEPSHVELSDTTIETEDVVADATRNAGE